MSLWITPKIAEDQIGPTLQRIRGVSAVDVFGGYRRQVNISIDRDRMEAAGLTLGGVIRAIQGANVSMPLGSLDNSRREVLLRIDEALSTPEEIKRIPVRNVNGQRLLLGDIAGFEDGAADPQSGFLANRNEVMALQVLEQDDANTVEVVNRVEEALPDLRNQFTGLNFEVATEEASFTELIISNMVSSIAMALVLASLIIFGFLASIHCAFVVSIAMPMSLLLTFALMKLSGMELDLVNLSAVILPWDGCGWSSSSD